jgi:Fe-Mn family superoxide dismutase
MDKRTFLKKSALLGIGGTVVAGIPGSLRASGLKSTASRGDEKYALPDLEYAYDALEPHIDAMTMEIHHSKHHAGYTRKFNAALKESGLEKKDMGDIFSSVSSYPPGIRNNGGGFYNHRLFWKAMSPKGGGEPRAELQKAIEKSFGSFDTFKESFSSAAATRFGSGWAWLVSTREGLKITSTPNQDNPLMDVVDLKGYPLLALDVWEHAYYLKYQNRRTAYIEAFWNVVNWDYVAYRHSKGSK